MGTKRSARRYVWLAMASAAAAALGWLMRTSPVVVETARAERGTLAATVGGEGKAQVEQLYVVLAPVDGELERIASSPGDAVELDEVVARIEPIASRPLDARSRSEAVAAVAAAQAAVVRADAAQQQAAVALEHAKSLFDQAQKLASGAAVPTSQAEHAGHETQIRRHALEEATAAAQQARAQLARAIAVLSPRGRGGDAIGVRAPAAGRILRVSREDAGPVSAGTPLLEIGDTSRLEVVADLLSDDAALVRPGASATISSAGRAQPTPARVERVDPAAFVKLSALGLEEQRVHVVLSLLEPPPPGLGHGYRVDVAIVVWQGKDVLRVPSTALFRSGDRWAAFVLRGGKARLVHVETGHSDATWTIVHNGLREGETVIAQPTDEVRDGVRVRP